MATKQRRVMLSLTPELDEAITRLQRLTLIPKATLIRQFLIEAVPQLNDLADVIEGRDPDAEERWVKLCRQRMDERVTEYREAVSGR